MSGYNFSRIDAVSEDQDPVFIRADSDHELSLRNHCLGYSGGTETSVVENFCGEGSLGLHCSRNLSG